MNKLLLILLVIDSPITFLVTHISAINKNTDNTISSEFNEFNILE